MGRRLPNPRRVKIHRTYDIAGVARLLGVSRATVRNWIKAGLEVVDGRRPILIRGATLREFLETRRATAKRTCPPGHFYCLRCRAPRVPAGLMADYVPDTPAAGNLKGICPDCGGWMNRRTSSAKIDALRQILDIKSEQAQPRLCETASPSLNCHFEGGVGADEEAQP